MNFMGASRWTAAAADGRARIVSQYGEEEAEFHPVRYPHAPVFAAVPKVAPRWSPSDRTAGRLPPRAGRLPQARPRPHAAVHQTSL